MGAGVVGAAVARELSRFHLKCTLLEAGPDVGAGGAPRAARQADADARRRRRRHAPPDTPTRPERTSTKP